MAKPPPELALPEIDIEERTLEVKVRLKGAAALDLADYQRAYQAVKGKPINLEPMVAGMLGAFIKGDKGFAAWRKTELAAKPSAK